MGQILPLVAVLQGEECQVDRHAKSDALHPIIVSQAYQPVSRDNLKVVRLERLQLVPVFLVTMPITHV